MSSDSFIYNYKNKEYGAYKLRKQYKPTVIISFAIVIFLVFGSYGVYYIHSLKKEFTEDFIISANITAMELSDVDIELPKEDLPEEETNEPKVELPKPNQDSVKQTKPDTLVSKPEEKKEDTKVVKASEENQDSRLKSEGVFSCGGNLNIFRNWFLENFKYPESLKNKKLDGKIELQFTVNKLGLIDSVRIVSGIDPIIDNEAKRVLKGAPRWKPCIINGRPVKIQYNFPVFVVPRK